MRRRHDPADTSGLPNLDAPIDSGFWRAMRILGLAIVRSAAIGGAIVGLEAWFEFLTGWGFHG